MSDDDATPEAAELGDVLLAPCGACGHWPGEHHVDTGCRGCRCERDMLAVEVDSVLASSWLAQREARIRAEAGAAALRDAVEADAITIPDALGYKVPAVAVEDLLNRADRIEAP